MQIFIASDHRGFHLKALLKTHFPNLVDVGASSLEPTDDYVDYALKVAQQLTPEDKAILICGSGHGMDITANRFSHVRAILGFNHDVVKQAREHEDANVLVLPADWLTPEQAKTAIDLFLNTPFSQDFRHLRRLEKLKQLNININYSQ